MSLQPCRQPAPTVSNSLQFIAALSPWPRGFFPGLPSTVSGGQQQRAAIARALANDPPLLVADEPTGNLDARTSAEVFDLFRRLAQEGKTLLMVTHDEDLACQVPRTLEIENGILVRDENCSGTAGPQTGPVLVLGRS